MIRRPRVLRLVLVAAALVLSCLAAEIALRVVSPIDRSLYQPDDLLLFAPKPNARRVFARTWQNGGGSVEVKFDSRGYRGPELAVAPRKRIVLYGDSYLEADWTPLERTFAADLQRRVAARLGDGVEVINAGVAAYGPDQAGLRMERELPLLQPDLVVLAIFAGNDFGDLLRNRIFRLDDSGRLLYAPHPIDEARLDEMRRAAHPSALRSLQLVVRLDALYEWLRDGVARRIDRAPPVDYFARALDLSRKEYVDAVVTPQPFALDLFDDHYDADIAVEPDAPSSRYKMALMAAVIPWLDGITRKAGRPLALLVIPSPIDVCDHYFGFVDPELHPLYDPARLSSLVAGIASRSALPYLDLYPAFRADPGDACPYFHDGDNHLNEAGQELAARLFDEFLARHGLP